MGKRVLVLASRNKDKVRELAELSAGLPFEVRSAADYPGLPEVIEDGTTCLGNAARKAMATAAYTGEISVADDTALQVDALGGLPDVFAARFAGPAADYRANCELLSEMMRHVPDGSRGARFLTAAVWVDPRPEDSGLDAAAAPGPETRLRWVHDPFRRTIHLADAAAEHAYWNGLRDRRAVWDQYLAERRAPVVTPGVDQDRRRAVLEELTADVRHGGRPAGADPQALRLPDVRIWTARGPADAVEPTRIAPAGLPAAAPGRAVNAPVWCELAAEGRVLGEIVRTPRGGRGFGYDPVFRPLESDRTLAEMGPEEKNALSHRGRAMRRLLAAAARVYAR
ncbi:MAG TPA: non-canonical purine NTP pyrophosphatase [Candidatus Krumholzibacteria bacterium]|nr:non-canonical purine NTP pyrophosphatase [Candidatus Krumholzibacteria bacterium]HRX51145.1 non-canonical purine NTP pyrophosphatase [Candidatus Krumholzibacteria bacterium]